MTDQKRDEKVKGHMTLDEVRGMILEEEEGYDAPFVTFTWQHWLEMHARANRSFSRFLRAIENRRVDVALLVGLEMQELATSMLIEAVAWIGSAPKEDLTGER